MVQVECSSSVLAQLSAAVRDGFRQFRHGGMEVGGLLFGFTGDSAVRIVDSRPLTIEYGRGAFFLLTEADHEAVRNLVAQFSRELAAKNLKVVGYYESHTRRGISQSETDFETYDRHFPQALNVCMILKPDREKEMSAAVYVRDHSGTVLSTDIVEVPDAVEVSAATLPVERPVAAAQPEKTVPPPPMTDPTPLAWLDPPAPPRRSLSVFALPLALLLLLFGALGWWLLGPAKDPVSPNLTNVTPNPPIAPPPQAPPPAPPDIEKTDTQPVATAASKPKPSKRSRSRRARSRTAPR